MINTLLSTVQAAVELELTRRRVQKFCEEGRFGRRVGGRYVISLAELRRFEKKRAAGKKRNSRTGKGL